MIASEPGGYHVFVSHSSDDKGVAEAVCAALEAEGLRCWMAPRDIVPGKGWGEAIIEGIGKSWVMVVVFSEAANQSTYVLREVERAVSRGMPIIPIRIEDVAPSAELELFLSVPHWLNAVTPPMESHYRQLVSTVHAVLGELDGGVIADEEVNGWVPNSKSIQRTCQTSLTRR